MENTLKATIAKAFQALYNTEIKAEDLSLQSTRKEFKGDFTFVVFPYLRFSKKKPEQTANEIGEFLKTKITEIIGFNTIKGFLNIELSSSYWLNEFNKIINTQNYGLATPSSKPTIMIEYSSPNTNKPLHLGHVRNNLVGYSVAEILKASGHKLLKVNLINDRGIHICKSMLAWEKWGNGETPESTNTKGDHLVGKYYVRFDKELKKEIATLIAQGKSQEEAEKEAPLMQQVQAMLRQWETGDAATLALWNKMNAWVYKGFDETYKRLGVDFDKIYHESETYLLGKTIVIKGLEKGIFYKAEDNSVWCDLTNDGFDKKILLRSDGTSVYMTQDIGTAVQRFEEFDLDRLIYVVGNEQIYHFKVLFKILEKLGYTWAKKMYHLSYGMVELPFGKMKSREGTVVDADDLLTEMEAQAKAISKALGKLENYTEEQANDTFYKIAISALKYFILKVAPVKTMLFNPAESIDFNGNTGPFILYTFVRIKSLLKKSELENSLPKSVETGIAAQETELKLIQLISTYPAIVQQAADDFNHAAIANYIYELVKEYNHFYHQITILKETNQQLKQFRLLLSQKVSQTIESGMKLLGINLPERM